MTPRTLSFSLEGREFISAYERFHGPLDNMPLSPDDLSFCRSALERCRRIAVEAPEFVRKRTLDPEVALRGGNWGIDKVATYFDRLVSGSEMSINHLRLLTYLFTGNRLYDFSSFNSSEWTNESPVDLPRSILDLDREIRSNESKLSQLEALPPFLIALHKHPEIPIPRIPPMFGEAGWVIDGVLFNTDMYVNYTYLQGLHRSGILGFLRNRQARKGKLRIVEIGPGWGCLAYNLKRLFPGVEYTFIDIPESIAFAYLYIATLFKSERAVLADGESDTSSYDSLFVPSHVAVAEPGLIGEADLVINTNSLAEMHPKQIAFYGDLASRIVGDAGVFYEVNVVVDHAINSLAARFGYLHSMDAPERDRHLNFQYRGVPRLWTNSFVPEVHELARQDSA